MQQVRTIIPYGFLLLSPNPIPPNSKFPSPSPPMQGRDRYRSQQVFRHKIHIRNLSEKNTGLLIIRDSSRLTVALVACIYPPFQSFSLCELGQHFCQHALRLVNGDDPFLNGVIALRKFQGKIPEGLNGVGFVVACYAGDLGTKCWYANEVMYTHTHL